jgi:hypothetical protein
MRVRIGGWTRVWVVLCVAFGAFALRDLQDALRYASSSANEAYEREVSWQDTCAKLNAKKAAGTFEKWDTDMYAGCSTDHSTAHAIQVRDQTLREHQSDAYWRALSDFLWPAGIVGALFLAIGWIRSGFRNRKTP